MSPNLYPVFSVSQYDKPEQIKVKIRMLIVLYLKAPNLLIADAVVKHIAAMPAHPNYIIDIEQRCLFRRLEMHWRCLVWTGDIAVISKSKKQPVDVKSASLPVEMETCR